MYFPQSDTIYIHSPKTAGNFVQSLFIQYSSDYKVLRDDQDGTHRFEIRGQYTTKKHANLNDYQSAGYTFSDTTKVVISVRNPVERAVSYYYSPFRWVYLNESGRIVARKPYWNLNKFKSSISHLPSMTSQLELNAALREPDLVIRFESLFDGVKDFCRLLRVPVDLSRAEKLNSSSIGDQAFKRRCRDKEVVDLVRNHYDSDFSYFGYT